jgi:glycosyltransferase involved in cell wall biosynthesis
MPALNEEKNVLAALDSVISAFKEFNLKGEVIVINDGSSDSTALLIKQVMQSYPETVSMLTHDSPKGIGASFWDGVDNARGNAVCMLPGDNENDPRETMRYLSLLNNVDMIIPFVVNKHVRSRKRNLFSWLYTFIINTTFRTSLNYTNGVVIYRKSLLQQLDYRVNGFIFQTDILIRLIKRNYLFAEVPYFLRVRVGGKSKACSLRSLGAVTKGYFRLVKEIYLSGNKAKTGFASDSLTAARLE